MNPGSFFREVLESHQHRPSDMVFGCFFHAPEHTSNMSDNANLLDIKPNGNVGRFSHHIVDKSAAMG